MDESSLAPLASASFDGYNSKLQAAALTTTRKAAALPTDLAFHRSMDRNLSESLDAFSQRVLDMTNRLLALASTVDASAAATQGSRGKGKGKGKGRLESQDDVVDNFHALVVDSVDQLLERTDTCLDEFWGKNKAPAIAINPPITSTKGAKKSTAKPLTSQGRPEAVIQHAAHLAKPQLLFAKKPDNSDAPWYPSLAHKYNAKVPLGYVYTDADKDADGGASAVSNHPYRYEITHLTYPARMFIPCTPIPPPPLEDTEAIWVDTKEDFEKMLETLRGAQEIAVDLEHHSYRSYAGFLCLMQISDRERDWVVDLLAVREEVGALNEVFTDPDVVKVFHGADSDVVWLQQDFNIYIVNLFDTFHASKLLDFPRHGLANLLEMYCDFIPDKRYQLADWRIRPLPKDMLRYARSDTHFLLYIYDNLRNALLDRSRTQAESQSRSHSPSSSSPPPLASSSHPSTSASSSISNPPTTTPSHPKHQHEHPKHLDEHPKHPDEHPTHLLREALSRSAETALRVYTKEPYDFEEGAGSGGWDLLARRWNKGGLGAGGYEGTGVGGQGQQQRVGQVQREVYRAVHWWRERVAREEDESTRYVLPNHTLFLLAEQPPADVAALLGMFRGPSAVPPVVKRRAGELVRVVRGAVGRGVGGGGGVGGVTGGGTGGGDSRDEDIRDEGIRNEHTGVESRVAGGAGAGAGAGGTTTMLDAEMKDLQEVEERQEKEEREREREEKEKEEREEMFMQKMGTLENADIWAQGLMNVPATRLSSLFGSSVVNANPPSSEGASALASTSTSLAASGSTLFGSSTSTHTKSHGDIRASTSNLTTTTAMTAIWPSATSSGSGSGSGGGGNAASTTTTTTTTALGMNSKHVHGHAVHPRFDELVRKINRSLSMGASVPVPVHKVIGADGDAAQPPVVAEPVKAEKERQIGGASASGTGMDVDVDVEVPYVAPSQRQTRLLKEEEMERDTIVVVGQAGQARARKRKRRGGAGAGAGGGVAGEEGGEEREGDQAQEQGTKKVKAEGADETAADGEAAEPFDFSTAPNILDDNPDTEARRAKRQKKQGGGGNKDKGGNFYGDFPAPPRAYSEVKSGNKSRTFR